MLNHALPFLFVWIKYTSPAIMPRRAAVTLNLGFQMPVFRVPLYMSRVGKCTTTPPFEAGRAVGRSLINRVCPPFSESWQTRLVLNFSTTLTANFYRVIKGTLLVLALWFVSLLSNDTSPAKVNAFLSARSEGAILVLS